MNTLNDLQFLISKRSSLQLLFNMVKMIQGSHRSGLRFLQFSKNSKNSDPNVDLNETGAFSV